MEKLYAISILHFKPIYPSIVTMNAVPIVILRDSNILVNPLVNQFHWLAWYTAQKSEIKYTNGIISKK